MSSTRNSFLENVGRETAAHLLGKRVPWLALGLVGGLATSVVVSRFEALLATDIRLAFFIPVIVYLSDAVGTQTETIYVRNLAEGKIRFLQYLTKETLVGVGLGVIFGLLLYAGALLWLHSKDIALAIGLSTLINLSVAPFLAVIIPSLLYRERTDPALGAGPLATIIQDLASLVVYFLIASAIVL
ncbi:MAG: hypothetical protein A3D67_03615 [Candidatus Lloydbacteria bacterium RIFCSPHIGHO2_02_FULL_51_22]|uniref:SLC41A/MgtE integral membrane domain-containing protein n=3 Tax=Candidatus Lloydiibacteriota TaxID=1817910 RepID=A0A1G2DA21_9BACT|nr:MAG: hypothetical protein A3D67_03615 [Candidatus Lloydbacteria bacterium RIFCSPHIGHO2_02_FULL_51_22]OGZ14092.1 MAG: hypothetical protein A3J08_02005 [Candidatus Lloydbacteria bacterium RIFCSPLOWO2_02_FULL_51_11]OGZ17255.1 MAG: hypothetical protein A3G11_01640 [Candidatus Lloydbacteria bacterium RIFCSPLOWO2_12_FULL_51_9]